LNTHNFLLVNARSVRERVTSGNDSAALSGTISTKDSLALNKGETILDSVSSLVRDSLHFQDRLPVSLEGVNTLALRAANKVLVVRVPTGDTDLRIYRVVTL
jgi:hypothetical protein